MVRKSRCEKFYCTKRRQTSVVECHLAEIFSQQTKTHLLFNINIPMNAKPLILVVSVFKEFFFLFSVCVWARALDKMKNWEQNLWRLINVALSFWLISSLVMTENVTRKKSEPFENVAKLLFRWYVYKQRVCKIKTPWIMVVVSCWNISHCTPLVERWTPGEVNYVGREYERLRARERERQSEKESFRSWMKLGKARSCKQWRHFAFEWNEARTHSGASMIQTKWIWDENIMRLANSAPHKR